MPGIEAKKHIDYGYTNGDDRHKNGGYRLIDRQPPTVLVEHVYKPLQLLNEENFLLNLGAGDGNFETNAPVNRRYSIHAIDQDCDGILSIRNIFLVSKTKHSDIAFVGDITKLDKIEGLKPVYDASVSWRVAHALPAEIHEAFFNQVSNKLKPGGHFYIAALSDRDWKAKELKHHGRYKPRQVNECVDVMDFRSAKINKSTWPLYFFEDGELEDLGKNAGLEKYGNTVQFEDLSGFEHLRKTQGKDKVTYHFIDLIKPVPVSSQEIVVYSA